MIKTTCARTKLGEDALMANTATVQQTTLDRIMVIATEAFDDKEMAEEWMQEPNIQLGYRNDPAAGLVLAWAGAFAGKTISSVAGIPVRSFNARKAAAASVWFFLRPSIWKTSWPGLAAAIKSALSTACCASAIGTPTPMEGIRPLALPSATEIAPPDFTDAFIVGLPVMVSVTDWVKVSPFFSV